MLLTCNRCGTEFDTHRDHPAGRYASTTRCPDCGCDHDVDDRPAPTPAPTEVAADGGRGLVEQLAEASDGEVHIHLHQE
ncbi:hypothetical protein [Halobellus ruber]|uniref:Uncharacterized protein n=1 Tax=Halobellus ruber TaxID=2761102 RepID=A0A7J9SP27_9EURY|nr:hypothetical protein [Halobellus ruber]MBB6647987.1 hypothetical protein [Halobellus ruber]